MSLKIWLPLNGNLKNQGLSSATITASGTEAVSGGKLGGQTYSFDGSDDYISIDSSSLYDCFKGGEYPFTIAMWIYFNETTGGRGVLLGDYNLSGAINFNLEINSGLNWNNDVRFYWAGSPDYRATNTAITSNTWVHLVVAYDGTQLKFYRNGILVNTREGTLSAKNKTAGAFYLGRDSRTGATAFNGKMNDIRIYDECLNDKEIKEIYKTLILHYKLNNSVVIKDYSGYKRNATVYTSGGHLTDEPDSAMYDNCIRFVYSNPCIISPTIDFSGLTDNFTISWWGKCGQSTMNGRMMWGFSNGNRLNLYPTSSKFCCNTGDGANNAYMNGSSTIPFSSYNTGWHHYAMTADGTNNKLYIDGVYKGTAQTYKGITGTQIILSGWDTGSSYKWSSGYLSDFRIYATTLLDSDIQQLAKNKMMVDNKQNLYTFELQENNYAQLDYLEATGTQYIITNIKMKDIAKVTLKFLYTDVSTNQGMFGWLHSGSETLYNRTICFYGATSDSKFHTRFGLERAEQSFNTSFHTLTMLPSRMFWDNGTGGGSSSTYTISYTQTMPIFALRNDGGADGFKNHSKAKLYYIKFYSSSGQLLGDFVPALDTNNVACLYDKVTQQFYYNQGTGNFSYGSITKDMRNKFKIQKNGILENEDFKECNSILPLGYKRLSYIEGTGTQYIDLNTNIDNSLFGVEIRLQMTDTDSAYNIFGTKANGNLETRYIVTELYKNVWYYNDYVPMYAWGFNFNNATLIEPDTIKIGIEPNNNSYKYYHYAEGHTYGYTQRDSLTTTDNLYLFDIKNKTGNKAHMKLYFFKLYKNNVLTMNLIPVEDKNGIACLYDTVSKTTFYNAGTGEFTKGIIDNTDALTYYNKTQIFNNKVVSNKFYEI